jgi:hypothetical protein
MAHSTQKRIGFRCPAKSGRCSFGVRAARTAGGGRCARRRRGRIISKRTWRNPARGSGPTVGRLWRNNSPSDYDQLGSWICFHSNFVERDRLRFTHHSLTHSHRPTCRCSLRAPGYILISRTPFIKFEYEAALRHPSRAPTAATRHALIPQWSRSPTGSGLNLLENKQTKAPVSSSPLRLSAFPSPLLGQDLKTKKIRANLMCALSPCTRTKCLSTYCCGKGGFQ